MKQRTFSQLWKHTQYIEGAFSKDEAKELYALASNLKPGSNIMEIGSYCGKSSSILGAVANDRNLDLTCIDMFVTPTAEQQNPIYIFSENMNKSKASYTLLPIPSIDARELYQKQIHLLFIDGDHRYGGVNKDIQIWTPMLVKDGHVVFHDYVGSWKGVKQAVDELRGYAKVNVVDTTVVLRKL